MGGLCNLSKIFVGIADGNGKSRSKDRSVLDCVDVDSAISIEESSVSNSESHNNKDSSSLKQNNVVAPLALKKRQKLHWGYDTLFSSFLFSFLLLFRWGKKGKGMGMIHSELHCLRLWVFMLVKSFDSHSFITFPAWYYLVLDVNVAL